MVVVENKMDGDIKYTSNAGDFEGHVCGYVGAMRGASPDGVHPWLHADPTCTRLQGGGIWHLSWSIQCLVLTVAHLASGRRC